jgi:rod shape-determining protein MreD
VSQVESGRVWPIWTSLGLALFLSILPLPGWGEEFRPPWVVLTLLFWALTLPERVGVFSAFLAGLTLDVTTGALLGHHTLGFAVVVYLMVELHQRVRAFPLWQQTLFVLLLLLLERLLYLWVLGATGQPMPSLVYWVSSLVGAGLWPWLFVVLRDWGRRAGLLS